MYSTTQAVGFDFGPDYIYFIDDSNSPVDIEPWVWNRDTGETRMLCSQCPRRAYPEILGAAYDNSMQFAGYIMHYHEATGEVYFDCANESDYGWTNKALMRVSDVGEPPELVYMGSYLAPISFKDYLYTETTRIEPSTWGGR